MSSFVRYKIPIFIGLSLFLALGYIIWRLHATPVQVSSRIPTNQSEFPVVALSRSGPSNFVLDKSLIPDKTSGGVYKIIKSIPQDTYEAILQYWSLPQNPTSNIQTPSPSIRSWNDHSLAITIDIKKATLSYENNDPAPASAVLNSEESATIYGMHYLEGLPFLRVNLLPIGMSLLKKNAGLEMVPARNFADADFIALTYGESIGGIPLITQDIPSGGLYQIMIDKKGAVTSFYINFFQYDKTPLQMIVFQPADHLQSMAASGDISIVDIGDETAFLDRNSLKDKPVRITKIQPAYFFEEKQSVTSAIYLIYGTVFYFGRQINIIGAYPAKIL